MPESIPRVNTSDRRYHAFWGKTRDGAGHQPGWHPVAYHSLDVAAVGAVLLQDHALPPVAPAFHPLLTTLLAWHDIGKFTRSFQGKVPALWPKSLGPFRLVAAPCRHDSAGYALLTDELDEAAEALMPSWGNFGQALLRAVCGHHGRPPDDNAMLRSDDACQICIETAASFAQDAMQAVGGQPASLPDNATAHRLAWQLAGLAVLADWVGSNEAWFKACADPMPLDQYWHAHALPQARAAVACAGIVPARTSLAVSLSDLAAHAAAPTPLQRLASSLDLPAASPALVVIEDQTGAGKTEAALLLAHRMMRAGTARGLFVALPTMATANAMYQRLSNAYRVMFDAGDAPSLVLAHGKQVLNEAFKKSILLVQDRDVSLAADPADEPAGAQCAAWVASDRRRTFLADVGVGTVDQALLAILPSRHAPLRLLGLSQRVLIVDEAHAYDAYMMRELQTLLAFHAGMGGSAIILSATLPKAQRTALVAAFQRGAGGAPPDLVQTRYPLVTVAGRDGVQEIACDPRPGLGRTVAVERLDTMAVAVARIVVAARAGLAVAWVRNTVDDAIEGHAALRDAGVAADLFHARFAMGDRLDIERAAMERFGHGAPQQGRAGRVLVATQVIEQSLDLDFDLMVSDLAPIDLLIQRAGRLQRHHRPDRPAAAGLPRLLVLSPAATDDAGADWLAGLLQHTRHIYRWTILWRSARVLFDAGEIKTPGDVRGLVEAVYAAEDDVPAGLLAALARETGAESAALSVAQMNVLRWQDGYARKMGWDSDIRTPTRLAEPSVMFRLARWDSNTLSPFYADPSLPRAWALSEISLAQWRAADVPQPVGPLALAVAAAKATWGRWDQDMPLLVLTRAGDGWEGRVVTQKNEERVVRYNSTSGLVMPRSDGAFR